MAAIGVAIGGCKKDKTAASANPLYCGDECEARCDKGEAAACALAAAAYFTGGDGRPFDMHQAFALARRACEGGDRDGCTRLGLHYQDGLATEWNPTAAVEAYTKGCAAGAGTSCYNLGSMYSGGHGVTADSARADALIAEAAAKWRTACEGDEPRWCTNLAYTLDKGQVAERLALNQRACDHHFLVGCTMATRDRRATGAIDETAELAEIEALCERGEPSACGYAAAIRSIGPPGSRDPVKARRAADRACELGDKIGCMLGAEASAGTAAEIDFLRRACDRASGEGCSILGRRLFAAGDPTAARSAVRRACQMGERDACGVLGQMINDGVGGPRDAKASIRWSVEACRMGQLQTCEALVGFDHGDIPVPPELRATLAGRACPTSLVNRACTALRASPTK